MGVGPVQAQDAAGLPDSIYTWRFEAAGGDRWGGTLVADSTAFTAGQSLAMGQGSYTILLEEERGTDLTGLGLEDGQVFLGWYWDAGSGAFLATRNGPGTPSGTGGLGSERDFAWTGLAWAAFGLAGALQADAAPRFATARFTWTFEAHSGDRWSGILFDLDSAFEAGGSLQTSGGTYRITGETALAPGSTIPIGTVRLTGSYFDEASRRSHAIQGADGLTDHGHGGLGSELGSARSGPGWTAFGQGGAFQLDAAPPAVSFGGARLAANAFGQAPTGGGWVSQDLFPRLPADVNGDGRADIIAFGASATFVALATASGGFETTRVGVAAFGQAPTGGGWVSQDLFPRLAADVNGDGRADIIAFGASATFVALATPSGGFEAAKVGIAGFGQAPTGGGWVSQSLFPRMTADVNGDGRADIIAFGSMGTFVSLARADGSFEATRLAVQAFGQSPNGGGWINQDLYPRLAADVNGDGRADIIAFGSSATYVALGRPDGSFDPAREAVAAFGQHPNAGGWVSQSLFPRMAADVNGDGRADIVAFGSSGTFVALATAAGSFEAARFAVGAFGQAPAGGGWLNQDLFPRMVADLNGDGLADLAAFGASGVWTSIASSPDGLP